LCAINYGEDGKIIPQENPEAHDDADVAYCSSIDPHEQRLLRSLQETVESHLVQQENGSTDPLFARLACAFAPPPHNHLHPCQVQSATLIDMDRTKLRIAVAVPSSESNSQQLVQVLIPVLFPAPIQTFHQENDLEDAAKEALRYIQQLDALAMQRIAKQEEEQKQQNNPSATAQQQRLLSDLSQEPKAIDWPDWWTVPQLTLFLADECKYLKSLLNEEEFAHELKALGTTAVSATSIVQQANVASIGPSGVFLRAQVIQDEESMEDDQPKTSAMVDIPIRFPQGEATTVDDLREYVLTLVERAASSFAQETLAVSIPPAADVVDEQPDDSFADDHILTTTEDVTMTTVPTKKDSEQEAESDVVASISFVDARRQPKPPEEEATLAAKYAAISDVGERAYQVLLDLGMIET
jgi:hypothetical protein